jgi:hypothetical protein
MDYDIFFSYPHKDAEGVKQILQVLQAEGLNVWIDKSEISDYASITNSIVVGLAHSKALLVINPDEKNHISLTLNHEESGAKTVHTLISRTVRFHETMPERIDQIQAAALSALIDKLSVIADGRIHSELKLEVAHARQLANRGDDIQTANLTGWVARYDHLHGAYKSAETLLRRESDIRNRLLGDEHPDTSLSAWNLVYTLLQMGNPAEAIDILKRDLLWLLQRESSDLEANQQKIREMIIQMIEQKDQSG